MRGSLRQRPGGGAVRPFAQRESAKSGAYVHHVLLAVTHQRGELVGLAGRVGKQRRRFRVRGQLGEQRDVLERDFGREERSVLAGDDPLGQRAQRRAVGRAVGEHVEQPFQIDAELGRQREGLGIHRMNAKPVHVVQDLEDVAGPHRAAMHETLGNRLERRTAALDDLLGPADQKHDLALPGVLLHAQHRRVDDVHGTRLGLGGQLSGHRGIAGREVDQNRTPARIGDQPVGALIHRPDRIDALQAGADRPGRGAQPGEPVGRLRSHADGAVDRRRIDVMNRELETVSEKVAGEPLAHGPGADQPETAFHRHPPCDHSAA